MRVTAYCACPRCCGRFADGLTACGYRIRPGDRFVAADKGLPFGMEIIVPGYNADRPVVVLDRGGLITGNRLDVYFDTHQQAKNWGVKYLDVLVKSG
jgi:3D (Asp-Asp-Asp) domain-containing protein